MENFRPVKTVTHRGAKDAARQARRNERKVKVVNDSGELVGQAIGILQTNDRGIYTVPTEGLYPFQWNWDSALSALGLWHFDESRAWTEIETLFAHQWPDGMVPHIIFHEPDDGYFPGPEIWNTKRPVPTTGITQPAVAGFAMRRLWQRARDSEAVTKRALKLLPKAAAWHRWFYSNRDPQGEGLVALIHPWEAGRDNSIDWDEAFERVPTEGVTPYTRRDLQHADASDRPTNEQYDRYIWLVEKFRSLNWDNSKLHEASPFKVVDPGFNAILIRSCADLAELAEELGEPEIAEENREMARKGLEALESLWSPEHGQYLCRDRVTGSLVQSPSIAGLIPAFADIPKPRAHSIAGTIEALANKAPFSVPSHDPADERFDSRRYWRGPVWLIVNYMISDGLRRAGATACADRIDKSSLNLLRTSGFAEYYDPLDGAPCGGGTFTWTAAMALELLDPPVEEE